ncbi:MAG: hypothetical protein NZ518_03960, partial [Dehalococcoidia bacterium]|nr:hypothetical protein [Dehalococcoidia bacterium]
HRQPDHVHFVHASHVQAGFQCETCHGNMLAPDPEENPLVRAFQSFSYSPYMGAGFDAVKNAYGLGFSGKVKQVRPLGMGDCVNCHRGQNELNKVGPLDCSTCHY